MAVVVPPTPRDATQGIQAPWVWETSWPLVVRLLVVFGVAGWNLLVFLPKSLQGGRP
jgi:hypothetical protein